MSDNWTPDEEKLHDALQSAAEQVQPGPDGLAKIRRRTARMAWWRNPALLGVTVGVATAAAAIVVTVTMLGTGDDDLSVTPADSPSVRSAEPSAEPSGEASGDGGSNETGSDDPEPSSEATDADRVALPLYFSIDGKITREWQQVDTDDPLTTAVELSLNGEAFDPRYTSLWSPVEVVSASVQDDQIEVDLQAPVSLDAAPELADQAMQQLVYTVTATAATGLVPDADGSTPVRVLIDGAEPEEELGGTDLSEPLSRAGETEVRYFVQIDSPGFGAEVSAPVTVEGVAALHEATGSWELTRDGEPVDDGIVTTEQAFVFAPFSIELGDLEPGEYEITVSEVDPSDGEGVPPRFERKEFTVEAD